MNIFNNSLGVALTEEYGECGINIHEYMKSVHILLIGLGGLGSVALTTMAGLGIKHFTLIDGDVYERSNVPRQYFASFDSRSNIAGHLKTVTCKKRLEDLFGENDCPSIHIITKFITTSNETKDVLNESFENEPQGIKARIIIDAIDDIQFRKEIYKGIRIFNINLSSTDPVLLVIWGNAIGFRGMTGCHVIKRISSNLRISSCYQCLYPSDEFTQSQSSSNAVATVTPFFVGTIMTITLLKIVKALVLNVESDLNQIHKKVTIISVNTCEVKDFAVDYDICTCDRDD